MSVDKSVIDNQVWLFLQGNLIDESVRGLDEVLQDSVSNSQSTNLILDFSRVNIVDSSFLLYLIRTNDDLQTRGYSLKFRNVPKDIVCILELIGLSQFVDDVRSCELRFEKL